MASKLIQLLSNEGHTILNITDNILCNLGVADIFALHATCRALRWLLGQMTESPYLLNVNKHLQHYFRDPSGFRRELGKCDGIICGAFVQNFLECNSYRNPILEIFIQEGPKSYQFIEYLLSLDEVGVNDRCSYGNETCYLLSANDPSRVIRVKKQYKPPIVELINEAIASVDLNFMTWNKGYSLLPVATVQKHKFYLIKPFRRSMGLGLGLERLARLGRTTRDLIWPDENRHWVPPGELHQIGGPKTLVIELADPPDGELTPDFVVESGIFSITRHQLNIHQEIVIVAEPSLPCLALRYQYVVPFLGQEAESWLEFVRKKLNRWMFIEFAKMHSNSTPPGFNIALGPEGLIVPSNYNPPPEESWTFADDQIGPWFAEWKREYEAKKRSGRIMPF